MNIINKNIIILLIYFHFCLGCTVKSLGHTLVWGTQAFVSINSINVLLINSYSSKVVVVVVSLDIGQD